MTTYPTSELIKKVTRLPHYHTRGYGEWMRADILDAKVSDHQKAERYQVIVQQGDQEVTIYGAQLINLLKLCGAQVALTVDAGFLKLVSEGSGVRQSATFKTIKPGQAQDRLVLD